MRFCEKTKRGVLSKPAEKTKVYVHRQAKYSAVVKKISDELFSQSSRSEGDKEYYLADSAGLPLCSREDGQVAVQGVSGEEVLVPWTLEFFMQITGIRYQSKVNLYCVEKSSG